MKQFVVIFSFKVPLESIGEQLNVVEFIPVKYPSSLQGWVNPLAFRQSAPPELEG